MASQPSNPICSSASHRGEQTLDALIRRIEGDRTAGRNVLVPHELVIRESSEGTSLKN